MTITPLPLNQYPRRTFPVTNITPFTYRDGLTYLETLECLRDYVHNTLVDWLNTNVAGLEDSWNEEVTNLVASVDAALAAQTTANAASIQTMIDYVNTKVQEIVDSSIKVTDPVVTALLNDDTSTTKIKADSLYASKQTETDVQNLTGRVNDNEVEITNLNTLNNSGRLSSSALDLKYGDHIYALDRGLIADGVTDQNVELLALITEASTKRIPLILEAGKTVFIDNTIVIPSNTTINMNGAIIKRGPTGSTGIFILTDNSNIEIYNGVLDGDKDSYLPITEWRHNINLDNSTNIYLHDLSSNRAKGDGIYIGASNVECKDIRINNVICDGNHRQGMSVIGVNGLTVDKSKFINTIGTAPEAGVDVEPNYIDQVIKNITFNDCVMTGNNGVGYLEVLKGGTQGGIILNNCHIDSNVDSGVRLTTSSNLSIKGGSILSNGYVGILHDSGTLYNLTLSNILIKDNALHGVYISALYSSINVNQCRVESNGASGVGDGLFISPSSLSNVLIIANNYFGQSPQRNGISTTANAANCTYVNNTYGGNTGVNRSLLDVATSRLDLDLVGKIAVTGAKGSNAALTSLITALAAKGIIVDSTTA